MNIQDLLDQLVTLEGSDIHLIVGSPPMVRIDGNLLGVEGAGPLTPEEAVPE